MTAEVLRSCSRPACTPTLFIVLSVAALLLVLPVTNGFVLPRSGASVAVSSDNNLQLFAKANGDGDISDESLYEDLRNRIQVLGLDGERSGVVGGGALSGKPVRDRKGAEADEEKEYVYIGGERFYLPSQASSSSRPTSMLDQGDRERPSDKFLATSLEEAKPSIIGSLEGLALAISLFFVVTVAATGGSLFASNINSSSSMTAATGSSSQRWDPDALLQEDFARDGSSVFYGRTFDE